MTEKSEAARRGEISPASRHYRSIEGNEEFLDYCRALSAAEWIAFDTEFVAEHTFRPVLCLVQLATPAGLAVIDPLAIDDVTPLWRAIAAPGRETIVHAGRGEVEFCLAAVGRPPASMFDVQIAAGFAGIEYPAGYGTLVTKILGEDPKKHETRTDWRKRPLSPRQVEYALNDVLHLHALRQELGRRLEASGRRPWFDEEMQHWLAEVERSISQDRWRRVSGNSGLSPRQLAIVRELYHWREREAERRDQPVRRVLRDDLIIELARRESGDPRQVRALRGLERGDLAKQIPLIAAAVQRALDLPSEGLPGRMPREQTAQLSVLGQFLFAALGSVCRKAQLSPSLVGGPNDIREWIGYHNAPARDPARAPKLARGWRCEFIGRLFDELLSGQKAVRVVDPDSECPLAVEP